jgi:leukotriene-A4 hydrolase
MYVARFAYALILLMISHSVLSASPIAAEDPHSYANARAFRTTHLALDLTADFAHKRLVGHVDLTLDRVDANARELVLDTRDLTVHSVELRGAKSKALEFRLDEADPILGAALRISVPKTGKKLVVRVSYETSPNASGLQWLEPSQTAGGKHPYLYSQSQAIHARSWIPLQDTPAIRTTYEARIRTPRELLAVMSARNDVDTPRDGDYSFRMPQPIPSYLIALGIGDLTFKSIGPRTGVFAEPSMVEAAAYEFADTEAMLVACERLFGPYRWERYDLLILPPSFMWGGMENPRLTFLTPTVISGDRSLVALIAHELAHSWSGNLVTNANWNSIWLNEGFTVYLERRIIEALYGEDRRVMEDVLGLQSLKRDIAGLEADGKRDLTRLSVDLKGQDPDDGFSDVPYEKGRLFLGFLEARLGRERLDAFLNDYFAKFSFQSVTTQAFLDYFWEHVSKGPAVKLTKAEVNEWIDSPGIPSFAVLPQSDAFTRIDEQARTWIEGTIAAEQLDTKQWTTHEWIHFLNNLPSEISAERLGELDRAFNLTDVKNNAVAHSWLKVAIRANYTPAWPRLENYLTSIGRRSLVKDLYEELLKSPDGAQRAQRIYAKARPLYQIPLVQQLDALIPQSGG